MGKDMEELIREWEMLPRGCRVLCAVSGGADSVCLLGMLYQLREKLDFSLAAAHFNHNLRGEESLRDEKFVRRLLAERFPDVPLYVGSGDVGTEAELQHKGLEETARKLRYAFLRETARAIGADRIATAHTADDNAETILLHLCRGTGLQGLTGISPMRGVLIRPLLTTTRAQVEEFLNENHLPHVEDSSNGEDTFARNRLRHHVLPVLEELYPGLATRLTENAARLREDETFLADQAAAIAARAEESGDGLSIPAALLGEAHTPVAIRAVRQLLVRVREGDDTCSAPHLESVLALCRGDSPSGEVHLPGGLTARRVYGALLLGYDGPEEELESIPLALPGVTEAGEWELICESCVYRGERQSGYELWLSQNKAPALLVRARQTGDTLRLPGRPGKTLKKWLVEEKIPRREREGLPILTAGEGVAAAARLGPDTAFVPEAGEDAWHIRFRRR